jgi:hypothetical protein
MRTATPNSGLIGAITAGADLSDLELVAPGHQPVLAWRKPRG